MPTFESLDNFEHGLAESLGVLLVNLGTPDEPTPAAVRRYLKQFLWDPRVVEIPRPLWWLILNGFILRFRPARSAHAYRKIWTDQGSPLLIGCEAIRDGLRRLLPELLSGDVHVVLGMSYGNPSIASALDELRRRNARRIVVLPLYPQYSGTTTGSVFDDVSRELGRWRWVPELRFINHYHDAPAYIDALASSIRSHWAQYGSGDHLLMSFHGVPMDTLISGDPYHCHCQKTARLLAASLELDDSSWSIAFQSRVGRAEWLRPYTDEVIGTFGAGGMQQLDVVCPGFSVDCLETLEEIAMQNAELFRESGGGELRYIPALNAREDHLAFLGRLLEQHVSGWPESAPDLGASRHEAEATRERAMVFGAEK